jgi:proteic killer suppression protein
MDVRFDDPDLDRLETDLNFTAGHDPSTVKGFRKAMQVIRAATDERDFYAMKSLRYEKLKGGRSHQHSLRITIKWRLIVELEGNAPNKIVRIKGIEDYH